MSPPTRAPSASAGDRTSEEDALVRALADPAFYPHRPEQVLHLQTHLSHVFIAGHFAYKLKKPVRFSFADFTDRAHRRALCLAEVRLNRRLCEPVYLGVLPIARTSTGELALARTPVDDREDEPPESAVASVIDHVVWMRALPASGMGSRALAEQRIDQTLLTRFAGTLARFHERVPAEPAGAPGSALDALVQRWRAVIADSAPMAGALLRREDLAVLDDFGPTFVRRHASLFEARAASGRIREGHGDLHLGNLCLIESELPATDGAPAVPAGLYAFDCIEFSRDLRVGDVAGEVAFLAMDIEAAGRRDLAQAFVDAYVAASDDGDLPIALPFFVAFRAAVRGMVHGLEAQGLAAGADRALAEERSRAHFALAVQSAWGAAGPALIACAGLSGSGKSALAHALAATTGFAVLSSDELRKRRAGLDPDAPAPSGASGALYARDARRANYQALARAAEQALGRGEPVIVDATFNRAEDRALIAQAAQSSGCPHLFLLCTLDDETARVRLEERARAARSPIRGRSDADFAVREQQQREHEPLGTDEPHLTIDTGARLDQVSADALRLLWQWRREHRVLQPQTQAALRPA